VKKKTFVGDPYGRFSLYDFEYQGVRKRDDTFGEYLREVHRPLEILEDSGVRVVDEI
jgi:hypothetical protein